MFKPCTEVQARLRERRSSAVFFSPHCPFVAPILLCTRTTRKLTTRRTNNVDERVTFRRFLRDAAQKVARARRRAHPVRLGGTELYFLYKKAPWVDFFTVKGLVGIEKIIHSKKTILV